MSTVLINNLERFLNFFNENRVMSSVSDCSTSLVAIITKVQFNFIGMFLFDSQCHTSDITEMCWPCSVQRQRLVCVCVNSLPFDILTPSTSLRRMCIVLHWLVKKTWTVRRRTHRDRCISYHVVSRSKHHCDTNWFPFCEKKAIAMLLSFLHRSRGKLCCSCFTDDSHKHISCCGRRFGICVCFLQLFQIYFRFLRALPTSATSNSITRNVFLRCCNPVFIHPSTTVQRRPFLVIYNESVSEFIFFHFWKNISLFNGWIVTISEGHHTFCFSQSEFVLSKLFSTFIRLTFRSLCRSVDSVDACFVQSKVDCLPCFVTSRKKEHVRFERFRSFF